MTELRARPGANAYGYFDEEAREYVITRPDTPTPWLNYIGEGRYGGIVSNTGGGYSLRPRPAQPASHPLPLQRRSRPTSPAATSTCATRRRASTGAPRRRRSSATWTATSAGTARPTRRSRATYEGIAAEILYFVPLSPIDEPAPCELWVLRVRNLGAAPRRLRSFSYVEFSFADAFNDLTNLDWAQHIVFSACEEGVIRVGTKFQPLTFFFASSETPAGYTCDREDFVGRGRDLADPDRRRDGRALERPLAARQQHRLALPRHRARPGRGAADRLHHGRHRAAGGDRPRRGALLGSGRGRRRLHRPARRLGRPTCRASPSRRPTPTRTRCSTSGTRSSAAPRCTGRASSPATRPASVAAWARATAARTRWARCTPSRTTPARMLTRIWQMQFADGHTWHQFFPLTGEGRPGTRGRVPRLAAVVQRRPPLADHLGLRLPARDRRLRLPRAEGAVRGPRRGAGLGAHAAGGRLHPELTAARTACRARASPTGTTPSTSTTARARPRASGRRCSSAGPCSTWPSCARSSARPDEAGVSPACTPRWPRRSTSTPGTAPGTCAPSTTTGCRSAWPAPPTTPST